MLLSEGTITEDSHRLVCEATLLLQNGGSLTPVQHGLYHVFGSLADLAVGSGACSFSTNQTACMGNASTHRRHGGRAAREEHPSMESDRVVDFPSGQDDCTMRYAKTLPSAL